MSTTTSAAPLPSSRRSTHLIRSHVIRTHTRTGSTIQPLPSSYTPHVFPDGLVNINHMYGNQSHATSTYMAANMINHTKDRSLLRYAESVLSQDPPYTKKNVLLMCESWFNMIHEQNVYKKRKAHHIQSTTPTIDLSAHDNPFLTPLLTQQTQQLLQLMEVRKKRRLNNNNSNNHHTISSEEHQLLDQVEHTHFELLKYVKPHHVYTEPT